MKILLYLSNCMIPFLIFYILGNGILKKQPVYDQFVEGAKDGMKTVAGILPTLVGLMIGVGVLRASGFMDFLSNALKTPAKWIGLPEQLIPLTIVKMFSSSAATGLLLDVYKQFGADSFVGNVASLQLSCTETIFYTMSVYFLATADKGHPAVAKTRYTLAGALFSTAVGVVMSVVLAKMM